MYVGLEFSSKKLKVTIMLVMVSLAFYSCKKNNTQPKSNYTFTDNASEVSITSYDYNGFKPLLEKEDDKVHVINFWATWCKPCVEELPSFEMVNSQYPKDEVSVTLVSLDMPSMLDSHLVPFIKKNKLKSEIVLLDDPDSDYWIRQINEDWTGAIPATIIYKNDRVMFYEQSFTFNELQRELKTFL